MLFEEKAKQVKPVKYTEDRTSLSRRITFKRPLAEETNKVIAVFNNESEVVKLNNSTLVAISLNCFLKKLEKLPEDEAITYLEKKALLEAKRSC